MAGTRAGWRLVYQAPGVKPRNVKKESVEASRAGFYPHMTLEEAKARQNQLKAQGTVQREERAKERARQAALHADAFLAEYDALGFEAVRKRHSIRDTHWNTMQKIIRRLPGPADWTTEAAYAIFREMRISPAYAKKLRQYLNHWARFIGQKHRAYYNLLGQPTPAESRELRINVKRDGGKSVPLTPEMLASARSKVPQEEFNWLYLSIWFGLRPREVDRLAKPNKELWFIQDGELAVFQEKLLERDVPEEKCWKYIPIDFPEQRIALQGIERGLKRPKNYALEKLWPGVTCYGGRAGMVQLLKARGVDLFGCRDRLGHQSIETTQKFYERRQRR